MEFLDKLLKAIDDLIEMRHITHNQFAETIGVDPGAWSRKRRGLTKLTKDDLDAMVKTYPELKIPVWQSIGNPDDPVVVQKEA